MKSIRLSLLCYFLVVLAVALGAVSWFVYHLAERSLLAKRDSTRALLLGRHESQGRTVEEELDERILRRAQTLARLAQSQWGQDLVLLLQPLGLLTAAVPVNGYLMAPAWLAGAEVRWQANHRRTTSIKLAFAEEVLSPDVEGLDKESFQIYDERGNLLQHSQAPAKDAFQLDQELRDKLGLFEWRFDDLSLDDHRLRRVTLKSPVTRFRVQWGPPPPWRGPRSRPMAGATFHPPGPPRGVHDRSAPDIFIQYVSETRLRDIALAGFQEELNTGLADLDADYHAMRGTLRWQLWWISLGTFALATAGGVWLVRLGLSPLQRLSVAVGQVSAKDFQLPFDQRGLPTELQPIVHTLGQTLDLLKKAFAREKQAAADISHELRTPLAALLATAELGLRKPRAPEEYRDLLANCHASGKQMSRLVERLLALARLDSGVDAFRPREVDVADLSAQCAALVRPLAEAHALNVQVHSHGPAVLRSDPDKLREIVLNLLDNAIAYNRPQGVIDLVVERQNGFLDLSVRDTGIGIAPQALEHIFDRFYRADPARQAEGLHAGLGLAIVKGYLDLMGGSIAVTSTLGQGSTFRVRFPAI